MKGIVPPVDEFSRAMEAATRTIVADLRRTRALVGDAVTRLFASFRGLEELLRTQSAALEEVTSALQKTSGTGKRSFSDTVEELVGEFINEAVRVSKDSMKVVDKLVDLEQHVGAIVNRTTEVERLARATRLLAMNAQIESARAGQHGQTFAIVAQEVKSLAGASNDLGAQIRGDVDEVRVAVSSAIQIGQTLLSHDMMLAVEARKTVVGAVRKLDQVNAQMDESLARIADNVNHAVRALQFDDMVAQLLDSAVAKVEAMSALAREAVTKVSVTRNAEALPAALADTTAQLETLSAEGPVRQNTLERGGAEIF